ncbi:hypothetical protein [Thiospirillum jenense]|uniref:Uncharacterized protein n=1 Tax=Thiospirillum jenense TaxID=1653858 RepID=A0A839HAH6_9GAMM|nr:hypothetical protein [Thiospirillum jenense]MBB1126103.1 hypothetical protein [Thiospirillum jenense]
MLIHTSSGCSQFTAAARLTNQAADVGLYTKKYSACRIPAALSVPYLVTATRPAFD